MLSSAEKTHTLESFGVTFEVTQGAGVGAFWHKALPPSTVKSKASPLARFSLERCGAHYRLVVDGALVGRAPSPRAACDLFEGEVALFVASQAPDRIFIHAGVVAWKGQAIVIPGRSMAGKTSLVAALLARGATYFSDEYAVIDERAQVHAYPRPLSVRQSRGLPKRVHAKRVGRRPLPVGLVLGLRYEATQSLRMTSLSGGRTALLLLDNAVAARISPARVLATVAKVAAGAMGLRGTRGEAKPAAVAVLARCETISGVVPVPRRKKLVRTLP